MEGTQWTVALPQGHAFLAAAELSSAITDFEYGLQCVRQTHQLFQQLDDQKGEIDIWLKNSNLAGLAGKNANLELQTDEALKMAKQMAYTVGMEKAKGVLGSIAYDADMPEAALQYHLQSIALWRELESPFELAKPLSILVKPCWKSANTCQRDRHSLKPEMPVIRWANSVASPLPYITWEKPH